MGGSQVSESNKSDRSQLSGASLAFLMYSSYRKQPPCQRSGQPLIGVLSVTQNGVVKADIIMMSGPLFN